MIKLRIKCRFFPLNMNISEGVLGLSLFPSWHIFCYVKRVAPALLQGVTVLSYNNKKPTFVPVYSTESLIVFGCLKN